MNILNQMSKNRSLGLEDLSEVRRGLKQLIDLQEDKMLDSAKSMIPFHGSYVNQTGLFHKFSPFSMVSAPLKIKSKSSLIDGVLTGFKVVRSIRRLIRR